MVGGPALVLGLLLILAALAGDRATEWARVRGPVVRFLLSPVDPVAWRATWAILGGAIVGVVGFSFVTTLFSAGASMLVVGIGVVVIALGIEAARIVARVERRRLLAADPRPLHPHPYRTAGPGLRERAEGVFLDISRWRDVVYVFIAFPLTILEATVVLVLLILGVACLSSPVWITETGLDIVDAQLRAASPAIETLTFAAGFVLLPAATAASRGLLALHRFVVANLLCVSEQAALVQRVETLETSRKAVLDVEATELRRIERDLHDGAQQRLVSLSMDLALAAERIDTDPAAARSLVLEAQTQARTALAELRDLVRGVAPSILMDRGLVPAVEALAARSPIPVVVASSLPPGQRLPDAVERAAYFVVAEALTNVAKHAAPAGATTCGIRFDSTAAALVIEVRDDGPGGAATIGGGGLAGLASRVEALDGHLGVSSPPGGGTTLRATIPLGR